MCMQQFNRGNLISKKKSKAIEESVEVVTIMGLGCSGVLKIPVKKKPRHARAPIEFWKKYQC